MTITTSIIVIVTITIIVSIIDTIMIDTIIDKYQYYCYHNYFTFVHCCYYYSSGRYDGPSLFPTIQNQAAEGWNYGSSASLWAVTTLW